MNKDKSTVDRRNRAQNRDPEAAGPARRILITGAARGQGASLAGLLLAAGAHVDVVDYLDASDPAWRRLEEVAGATPGVLRIWRDDVALPQTWEGIAAQIAASGQGLDGLVNNAGITGPRRTVTQTELADWERVLSVNLTASMLAIRALAPLMPRGGSIVNIASTVGMTGYYSAAYSCSKWALRGLTRAAALELAPRGIRVNCVCPGVVDTEMIRNSPALMAALAPVIPMQTMAQPRQIADAVMFLLGSQSSYITATDLAVDGGVTGGGIFWPVGQSVGALQAPGETMHVPTTA